MSVSAWYLEKEVPNNLGSGEAILGFCHQSRSMSLQFTEEQIRFLSITILDLSFCDEFL